MISPLGTREITFLNMIGFVPPPGSTEGLPATCLTAGIEPEQPTSPTIKKTIDAQKTFLFILPP